MSSKQSNTELHAGWKIQQPDGAGSVYYFYPDGVLVIQNPRRREFVRVGKWVIGDHSQLTLFDIAPRNTTLSPEEIKERRRYRSEYTCVFESDQQMQLIAENSSETLVLCRIKDLPNRSENRYWGFRKYES